MRSKQHLCNPGPAEAPGRGTVPECVDGENESCQLQGTSTPLGVSKRPQPSTAEMKELAKSWRSETPDFPLTGYVTLGKSLPT